MVKKQSVGEEIYHGTAFFGKITAVISAVIGTIICIALIGFGIYLLVHKSKHTATASGKVITSVCIPNNDNSNYYNCTLTVAYNKINNTIEDSSSPIKYEEGAIVTVYYDPSNPSDASLEPDTPKTVGWVLIIIAVVVLILLWVWVYVTQKSETAAAVGGAAEGLNILSGGRLI